MITIFSQGDFDFVMRGGPWIFRRNALVIKPFNAKVSPSENILDAVLVWVRIYDVPGEKQNKHWGMRYGNGLGKAVEVDVPDDENDMHEFLRVRVELPYNRRLQTQLTTGVKGKPGQVKVYKLKYERVPYFCSHCGFMGHRKEGCEKRRRGVPSLDYEAYELRCSPYKKFEYRTHFVPPQGHAAARRGLSFSSFGSAESRKSAWQSKESGEGGRWSKREFNMERSASGLGLDDMPPLEEDGLAYDIGQVPVGVHDGFEEDELEAEEEVAQNLLPKIDAMQVEAPITERRADMPAAGNTTPIIQFPEEEEDAAALITNNQTKLVVDPTIYKGVKAASHSGSAGPRSSDMIPPMRGISQLQVSFGSAVDVNMIPADSVLGKRPAEEEEVQGQRLNLSLGLNYGAVQDGAQGETLEKGAQGRMPRQR
jgi:hypothetical protein